MIILGLWLLALNHRILVRWFGMTRQRMWKRGGFLSRARKLNLLSLLLTWLSAPIRVDLKVNLDGSWLGAGFRLAASCSFCSLVLGWLAASWSFCSGFSLVVCTFMFLMFGQLFGCGFQILSKSDCKGFWVPSKPDFPLIKNS